MPTLSESLQTAAEFTFSMRMRNDQPDLLGAELRDDNSATASLRRSNQPTKQDVVFEIGFENSLDATLSVAGYKLSRAILLREVTVPLPPISTHVETCNLGGEHTKPKLPSNWTPRNALERANRKQLKEFPNMKGHAFWLRLFAAPQQAPGTHYPYWENPWPRDRYIEEEMTTTLMVHPADGGVRANAHMKGTSPENMSSRVAAELRKVLYVLRRPEPAGLLKLKS